MKKNNIYGFTFNDLHSHIKPDFRIKQIFDWLYNKYEKNFFDMSNLGKEFKIELDSKFNISNLTLKDLQLSNDGSKKYLFQTFDNHTFESVFIKMKEKRLQNGKIKGEKYTFCVSSQIGCAVGCSFCSTAKGGFIRNLNAEEIVEQIVFLKRDNYLDPNKAINIVFMGMGEPLLNLKNVIKAIKIMNDKNGLNISPRRITISTSGISPKIKDLGSLELGIQIAISLHAVDDELRSKLIPMNKVYNIKSILDSLKLFKVDKRKKIMFEYLVIKDVNDDLKSAKKLVSLLNGFSAKVNLISFNPHMESEFQRPDPEKLRKISDFLFQKGITATIRESKGIDINAACGQLRQKHLQQ